MNTVTAKYYWDVESQQYLPSARSVRAQIDSMGYAPPFTFVPAPSFTSTESVYCPDLLRLSDLGEADNWRGRVVRGFFRFLTWTTGV